MKQIRSIIFDLDGTLIDSSEGVVDAVNYSLRQVGSSEQPPEKIKPFIGFPLSRMYPEFTDAPMKELFRHFQERAAQVMDVKTVALNGAETVLRQLKGEGYRLAVATTKIRRHIDGILTKLDWVGFFEATVGGDEVAKVKPDPEAFRLALSKLKTTPAEALVVGDTINDVQAARGVPVTVVAVNSPYGGRYELVAARPDHFVERIAELPALLGRIAVRRNREQ